MGFLPKSGNAVKIFPHGFTRALAREKKIWYTKREERQGRTLMQKFLTDIHTHSQYSFDGKSALSEMLQTACSKGLAFYGVSEHFDYDAFVFRGANQVADSERYFHDARHLQEDYEGCMNVAIGAEFGYADDKRVQAFYQSVCEKYRPDFAVNSVHALRGDDYSQRKPFYQTGEGGEILRRKEEVYREYLRLVRRSLDAPYAYDIVGHIGYLTRYAPYADREMRYADYATELDEILKKIIQKDKILELNAARGAKAFLPSEGILARYFALGGRKVSYGSDAHEVGRIAYARDEATALLKAIGFTHLTLPFKGEYIKVEI